MGDWQAKSAYVSERCCVWQSQLESVHKATCFSVALTILLVPLGGAFMCKSCQWLSEVPALLWSNVKEVCHYSFYWTHSDETDFVKADLWCQGALGMVLLRIVIAGLAFFKTDFWSLFVCGCASSLLCLGQNEFMKKNDEANSVRIASYIVAEKPDLKLQDAGLVREGSLGFRDMRRHIHGFEFVYLSIYQIKSIYSNLLYSNLSMINYVLLIIHGVMVTVPSAVGLYGTLEYMQKKKQKEAWTKIGKEWSRANPAIDTRSAKT